MPLAQEILTLAAVSVPVLYPGPAIQSRVVSIIELEILTTRRLLHGKISHLFGAFLGIFELTRETGKAKKKTDSRKKLICAHVRTEIS